MKTRSLVRAGAVSALYVLFTLLSAVFGLSGQGLIQCRFSEALTVLPVFLPEAIPGLFIGCLLSGVLTGALPADILIGSFATLLGAFGARLLRRRPYLSPLPAVLANTALIPPVLSYFYGIPAAYPILLLTVFAGEFLSAFVLGLLLYRALKKYEKVLFTKR